MKLVGFILIMLLYTYACYLAARGYWHFSDYLHRKFRKPSARTVVTYAWFLAFVAMVIPVGIFFPAWLSEKWEIFAAEPGTTTLLLLFGCAVLALATWGGWRSTGACRASTSSH